MTKKKSGKTMRLAGLLLVLVLVTSCFVGGTFAKYVTSGTGTDSARVAKFGVNVNASADSLFQKQYDSDTTGYTAKTVITSNEDKLVAPGTKGDLTAFTVSGKPEVAVEVKYTVDEFELTNWSIPDTSTGASAGATVEYCPIVFKVNDTEYKIDGTTITSVSGLQDAVKNAIQAVTEQVAANTDLSTAGAVPSLKVEWEWAFQGTGTDPYQTDAKDTALGDQAADDTTTAGKIDLQVTMTVTQID